LCIIGIIELVGCTTYSYYSPVVVTDNEVVKVGQGSAEEGVAAIAKRNGITKIATVDYYTKMTIFRGNISYERERIIVSGE
jgi:hypothetical protein